MARGRVLSARRPAREAASSGRAPRCDDGPPDVSPLCSRRQELPERELDARDRQERPGRWERGWADVEPELGAAWVAAASAADGDRHLQRLAQEVERELPDGEMGTGAARLQGGLGRGVERLRCDLPLEQGLAGGARRVVEGVELGLADG